jgi:hypothetical protein
MTLPTSTAGGSAGLHVRYEKAGLILDALPIPWNADAVIVEANVRLPKGSPRDKQDFTLRLTERPIREGEAPAEPTRTTARQEPRPPDEAVVTAELIAPPTKQAPMRVFFRIPAPAQPAVAHVFWREHSLGQAELPMIAQAAFDEGFALSMPAVHVVLGERTVACQSFVAVQAKGLLASAIVHSAAPLAAALTMGLRVDLTDRHGNPVGSAEVPFTSEQLRLRQTLVTVHLPKPRIVGAYEVAWHLAARCLHRQKIAVVSRKALLRSLRISATRFHITRDDGTMQTVRALPTRDGQLLLDGIAQVAPIFFVCSSERGMAGLVPFTMRALVDDLLSTAAIEESVLVTDGPTPLLLGVSSASSLSRTKHFTLATGDTVLGNLALLPAPKVEFSAEGGFAPLDDFLWSPAAEELLNDRLGKLLDDG